MTRHAPSTDTVAVRWLIDRGVWLPGKTHAENMQRCADFRAKYARLGSEPGKQWARDIIADYRAGVVLQPYGVKLAFAALGMPEEPLLHRLAKPVPRPDAKERQAGDVEVVW